MGEWECGRTDLHPPSAPSAPKLLGQRSWPQNRRTDWTSRVDSIRFPFSRNPPAFHLAFSRPDPHRSRDLAIETHRLAIAAALTRTTPRHTLALIVPACLFVPAPVSASASSGLPATCKLHAARSLCYPAVPLHSISPALSLGSSPRCICRPAMRQELAAERLHTEHTEEHHLP